jgi:Kef-type K+ transport system membrane component KefB
LQTRLQDVFTSDAVVPLVGVLLVAIVAKMAGVGIAALILGEKRRSAFGLGVMMNCRGLTELVVLKIGLSLGVIRTDLFSVLVVMTLVTTMMTDPLLRMLRIGHIDRRAPAPEPELVAAGSGAVS